MREGHSQFKAGYIRLHVQKIEKGPESWSPDFEILECDNFSYGLSKSGGYYALDEELSNVGAETLLRDDISRILKEFALGDAVEIVGDVFLEYSKSWTDCGWEYDMVAWLEDEKHQKKAYEEAEKDEQEEDSPLAPEL